MTAFLFIPATCDARLARRVDFANIAAMFAEAEEPPARVPALKSQALRVAAIALMLIGIVGDTVLVARPKLITLAFAMNWAALDGLSPGA